MITEVGDPKLSYGTLHTTPEKSVLSFRDRSSEQRRSAPGMSKKLGRGREGVSEKGVGMGRKGITPSPYPLFFAFSRAVFVPFASVWKRKENDCYAC